MRGSINAAAAMMVILLGAGAAGAQTAVPRGPISSSPAGSSTPVADLNVYERSLEVALQDLRDAAGRPDAKNVEAGAQDAAIAHANVLGAMQQALGIVRSAPLPFRDQQAYKDAVTKVRDDTQHVEGQHEPSPITASAEDTITAIETLRQQVAAAAPAGK